MNNVIETNALCKRYGDAMRVKNLQLSVPEGAVYGFLGPNGAGKSTSMKMILGLTHPSSGSISVFGKPMQQKNRLNILRDVGSLIESPSYYGHLTGYENLRVLQTLRGIPESRIDMALGLVRLERQKDKRVAQYSLGMKQRLGLAAALLAEPKLLLLDEPTNGLDPAGIQEMRELICTLPRKFGITVLVSSHLLTEIDQMATHVGIITDGTLVFQDTMERLHEKSEHYLLLRTLDNEQAQSVLRQNGHIFRAEEDCLILPLLENARLAACIRELVRAGVGIVRLEEHRKNLEDIFMELTQGATSL